MSLKISVKVYKIKAVNKANILIIHGMCEHKERYDFFAKTLAKKGFTVYSYDQIGHNLEDKNALGYFGDDGWNNLVKSAHDICLNIKKESDLPLIVFAHSMGSIVARSLLRKNPDIMDGLILSGPPYYRKSFPLLKAIMSLVCKINGDKTKNEKIYKTYIKSACKDIKNCKTDYDWLSYNEKNVENFIGDEKCGFALSNRGYYNLIEGLIDIHNEYEVTNRDLPILILVGKDDIITGYEKGINQSIMDLKKFGYENIYLNQYQNARHEILNEEINEVVIKDVETWLFENFTQENK